MAVDVIQFVDSIASSPTVRLDINDGATWRTTAFAAPPPRLRRAMSSNAMGDGVHVSSSSYDSRVITLGLTLVHTSEDSKATEIQKLARELDRDGNFLRYQPSGASKPVFFRLFRSDMSQLEQFTGTPSALAKPTVELLAEPFALGLRETLGPFTVNNDPAAGSNGHYFDVTGVIGDVATPCVMVDSVASGPVGWIGIRSRGTPSDMSAFQALQAEGGSLGTDTTNPGGGPDAVMSGAGTNNFIRTSFATATAMTERVSFSSASLTDAQRRALRGSYRVLAVVRRSDATSVMSVRASRPATVSVTGSAVTVPAETDRQVLDLGVFTWGGAVEQVGGLHTTDLPLGTADNIVSLSAARASGTGTLDWDYVLLVPADTALLNFELGNINTSVFDGLLSSVYSTTASADPFASTSDVVSVDGFKLSGGFPSLVPNQTNRLFLVIADHNGGSAPVRRSIAKADTASMTVHYWPRYLFVRPSAT